MISYKRHIADFEIFQEIFFVPQQGGLTWAFNTQLYLEEYYPDFNPGIWVAMDSIVGGRFVTFFLLTV